MAEEPTPPPPEAKPKGKATIVQDDPLDNFPQEPDDKTS